MKVLPSNCGFDNRLSYYETFRIFMDIANVQAEENGIDQGTLMNKGLFWMIARTRIVFHRRPFMQEIVTARTWPLKPGSRTGNRCYTLSDNNGLIAEGLSEWIVFDNKIGSLSSMEGFYPPQYEFSSESISFNTFPRLRPFEDNYTVKGNYQVSSSDIDMGLHMNNTIYIRAMLGLFSIEELEKMNIREISVVYKNPAHLDDMLQLRTRTVPEGLEAGFYFEDGRPAMLAMINATSG